MFFEACSEAKIIDLDRENRKLNICFNEKCKEWFKYIYSGNVYNIWDTTIIAQSDADKKLSEVTVM